MVLLSKTLLAIGVLVLAIGGYLLWFLYGGGPPPAGYSFPRHSMLGGPQALFKGSLENVEGCIRTAGEGSLAVVWPTRLQPEHRRRQASHPRRLPGRRDGR